MKIEKLSVHNLTDINKANEPFEIIGKLKPSFVNDEWIYTEEIYSHSYVKSYADDDIDYSVYIDNPDKVIFFAYLEKQCIGQIVLRRDWIFIEDICVSQSTRGQGIGSALMLYHGLNKQDYADWHWKHKTIIFGLVDFMRNADL